MSRTPGPWKACRSDEDFDGPLWDREEGDELRPFTAIRAARGATVVSAHDLCEIDPEDAVLLAAAPELLSVVQGFRRKLETYVNVYTGDKELRRLLSECDAAITKATEIPV